MASNLRSAVLRQASRVHGRTWWLRAMTFGVRAIAVDHGGVLLVRHTYVSGWYLPGGGVDRGETAEAAIRRELREEAGARCLERPALFGLYRNGRRDHVACFVVRQFELERGAAIDSWEIAEANVFPLDGLPEDTTRATRARLLEWQARAPLAEEW